MKICIPLHAIHHRKIGGTESAIYNLVRALSDHPDVDLSLLLPSDHRLSAEFASWVAGRPDIDIRRFDLPGPKAVRFIEETIVPVLAPRADWILYPNYYAPPVTLGSRGARTAILVHDIQYRTLPHFHSRKRRAWLDFFLPIVFRKADRILTISDFERTKIEQNFGMHLQSKLAVIGNVVDFRRFEGGEIRDEVRRVAAKDFVLSVFHPFPHKNFDTLIKAFERMTTSGKDLHLVIIGQTSGHLAAMIRDAGPEMASRITHLGFVSDAELGFVYSKAKLFVHTSLYEGFGMPLIEAMGFGVPVLAAKNSAVPEVTMNLATYVDDPLDPEDWSRRATSLLERPPAVDAALARDRYSPRTIADKVVAALA